MHDILFSPFIVPVAGIALAGVAIGFNAWRKVREKELAHQLRMKELEIEALRLKGFKEP
jgi:hypothetical protein